MRRLAASVRARAARSASVKYGVSRQAATVPMRSEEALLSDSVGAALQVVLDTLEPRERLAFVLHDLFGVPFDEIAPVVGASPAAARHHEIVAAHGGKVRGAFWFTVADGRITCIEMIADPDVLAGLDIEVAGRDG